MSEPPRVRRVQEALDGFRPSRRTAVDEVAIEEALGRVPALAVLAETALPGFARSAVDGYAVSAADTATASRQTPAALEVIGTQRTGEPPRTELRPATAVAIPTGGALPGGADAVVMVEDVAPGPGESVVVSRAARPGQHVVGEDDDFAVGAVLVEAGRPIGARELAALSAAGIARISVRARPRVAIISTGDEVVPPETASLRPGQVRDAIAPALAALVRQACGEPIRRGIVPDNESALEAACREALRDCDMVVLSAGSSVGERDLTARVIERLGPPGIWCHGLSMRPGRPTLLADVAGVPVIGLPGNPLSALVVFELIGCPLVRRMAGFVHEPVRASTRAVLAQEVSSALGRLDIVQVRLAEGEARPLPKGSALLSTLVRADGQLVVPEERVSVPAGEQVEIWLASQ
ncbi:MAG: molybdopterin molybdotransferase [Gaiellales bacterium]|nr:molybdopterin molybdotransferase [Gaiellales bacterium]